MASPRQSQQKIKMGWVEKKSKHLGIFRKRWIEVYAGDKLCSFKQESDNSPSEIIDLSGIHKAYQSNLGDNEFIIAYLDDSNIKSRRFRTSSHDELISWIQFFNPTDQTMILTPSPSSERDDRRMISQSETQYKKKKSKRSLEDIIEDIAYDVTYNHQYLKVVLECGVKDNNVNEQRYRSENSCN